MVVTFSVLPSTLQITETLSAILVVGFTWATSEDGGFCCCLLASSVGLVFVVGAGFDITVAAAVGVDDLVSTAIGIFCELAWGVGPTFAMVIDGFTVSYADADGDEDGSCRLHTCDGFDCFELSFG